MTTNSDAAAGNTSANTALPLGLTCREEQFALERAFQAEFHRAGRSGESLSRELGFHPLYLQRALAGGRRLRVDLAFELLSRLRLEPSEFFAEAFPLGGSAYAEVIALAKRQEKQGGQREPFSTIAGLVRRQAAERGPITPRELELRSGALLRAFLARKGLTQRAAARALGLGQDALAQVLRGAARLTFFHLFGVLRLLEVTPGRFFLELFLPAAGDREQWGQRPALLDMFDRVLEGTSRGLLMRWAAEEEPKPELPTTKEQPEPG